MAIDQMLLERAAATREAVIRVYGWSRPTLSLGRNQTARGRYDLELARRHGVEFVRRPTGGRALLHHRELTYSVSAPADALGTPRESYTRINRLLVDALTRLGIPVEVASPGSAPPPDAVPCFHAPVAGEVVVGGRKLVGSAQTRDRHALLQHGSILMDDDQWLASALLVDPSALPPSSPPASVRQLLGRALQPEELADALAAALCAHEGVAPHPLQLGAGLRAAAGAARRRFDDDSWTWRR